MSKKHASWRLPNSLYSLTSSVIGADMAGLASVISRFEAKLAGLEERVGAVAAEAERMATFQGAFARSYADQAIGGMMKAIAANGKSAIETRKLLDALRAQVERLDQTSDDAADRLASRLDSVAESLGGLADKNEQIESSLSDQLRDARTIEAQLQELSEGQQRYAEWVAEQLKHLNESHSRLDALADGHARTWSIVHDQIRDMRNAEARLEFIRTEILFELQAQMAAIHPRGVGSWTPAATRLINERKINAARQSAEGLRLNVGCGHVQPEGYVNVDRRQLPGIDAIGEATELPFAEGEVSEIFSSHVVEHFPQELLKRAVLPYWLTMLKPGGRLVCVAPDGDAMLAGLADGSMSFEDFRSTLFGGQDYEGDFHFNLLTTKTFSDLLTEAGFVNIFIEYSGKRNGKCFEFRMGAEKRSA